MSPLTRTRPDLQVTTPAAPEVEPIGRTGLAEVTRTTPTAHCHHSDACLTPLCVGELVVPAGRFYALLDHVDTPPDNSAARVTGGGAPDRL